MDGDERGGGMHGSLEVMTLIGYTGSPSGYSRSLTLGMTQIESITHHRLVGRTRRGAEASNLDLDFQTDDLVFEGSDQDIPSLEVLILRSIKNLGVLAFG